MSGLELRFHVPPDARLPIQHFSQFERSQQNLFADFPRPISGTRASFRAPASIWAGKCLQSPSCWR